MTRVLVCGGREFNDVRRTARVLDSVHAEYQFTVLIEGGNRGKEGKWGADQLGMLWAQARGVPVETYEPDWEKYPLDAGTRRNGDMLRLGKPDLVVAFPGNSGTENMVKRARKAGIFVIRG
jgi:YspA, cpYpsA-related SLOG family